jgi:hypothetical protein
MPLGPEVSMIEPTGGCVAAANLAGLADFWTGYWDWIGPIGPIRARPLRLARDLNPARRRKFPISQKLNHPGRTGQQRASTITPGTLQS